MPVTQQFAELQEIGAAAFVESLVDQAHREIYHYWLDHLHAGGPPDRAALDPVRLPKVHKNLILASVDPDAETVHFRLVGTQMVEFWGEDITDQEISNIMQGEYLNYIRGMFLASTRREAPVFGESAFRWDQGRVVTTRPLFLPFFDYAGGMKLVLVCQIFDQKDLEIPVLFSIGGPPSHTNELQWSISL